MIHRKVEGQDPHFVPLEDELIVSLSNGLTAVVENGKVELWDDGVFIFSIYDWLFDELAGEIASERLKMLIEKHRKEGNL